MFVVSRTGKAHSTTEKEKKNEESRKKCQRKQEKSKKINKIQIRK